MQNAAERKCLALRPGLAWIASFAVVAGAGDAIFACDGSHAH